jgi:hypothetical protein
VTPVSRAALTRRRAPSAGYITAQEIGIAGGLELNTFSMVGTN